MSRKNLIYNFKPIVNGDMTQSSLTGSATDISQFDTVTYDFLWSGGQSSNGTIGVQYSRDNINWYNLDFGTTISLGTVSGDHNLVITEVGFQYARPYYTQTNGSATGLLNVTIFCTTKGA